MCVCVSLSLVQANDGLRCVCMCVYMCECMCVSLVQAIDRRRCVCTCVCMCVSFVQTSDRLRCVYVCVSRTGKWQTEVFVYVCVYVCMCVYVYMYVSRKCELRGKVCVYVCVFVCMWVSLAHASNELRCVCKCVCVYLCVFSYTRLLDWVVCLYMCLSVYIYVSLSIYMCLSCRRVQDSADGSRQWMRHSGTWARRLIWISTSLRRTPIPLPRGSCGANHIFKRSVSLPLWSVSFPPYSRPSESMSHIQRGLSLCHHNTWVCVAYCQELCLSPPWVYVAYSRGLSLMLHIVKNSLSLPFESMWHIQEVCLSCGICKKSVSLPSQSYLWAAWVYVAYAKGLSLCHLSLSLCLLCLFGVFQRSVSVLPECVSRVEEVYLFASNTWVCVVHMCRICIWIVET